MSDLKTNLEQILQEKQTKIIPENIKKNVEIFGITGTLEAEINTSDATATSNDILYPKTAYVDDEKIVGNITTTPLQSSLVVVNEQKSITATNNNILDYFKLEEEEYVISSSSTNRMSSIIVQNSVIQNTINISNIKSGCVLLSARFFDLNIAGEIGLLVMLQNGSGKVFFGAIALNINSLQITNTYIYETEESIGNYAAYGNIVYNKIKDAFAMMIKWTNGQDRIYIIQCDKNNIQQISKHTNSTGSVNSINYLMNGCWSDDGTKLLVRCNGGNSSRRKYHCYLLCYNSNLTSSTLIRAEFGAESYVTSPYQFLNDDYLINGNNQIYKINTSNISLQTTVSNININNKNNQLDMILILNNCFYLYFSVTNGKVYVYKYDESFNFTFEKEIDWSVNPTYCTYSHLLYCPYIADNIVKYSELNKITEVYTSTNSPDFASLHRNDIDYFNTSDADILSTDVLSGKIGYGETGKITGTMPNNGELNYTPNTTQQTIPAGYTSGGTVAGDSNLIPENIKKDVQIFDITGTYEEEGGDDISNYINTQPSGGGTIRALIIKTPEIDMINMTNLSYAFESCSNLTSVSLKNTNNAKTMTAMFRYCSALPEIINLNTSNVTSMEEMFYNCNSLVNVSLLNSNKVTTTKYMFKGCTALKSVAMTNTNTLITTSYMFGNCKQLENVPLLDMSNVKNMDYMFEYCSSLTEIPNINTTNVKNMCGAFSYCSSLTTIPQLNMNKVTNLSITFENCSSLSDDSLNNILASLLTATSYTYTKTLKYIGLSEEQATKCTTLSNWSTCEAAGWTTGY